MENHEPVAWAEELIESARAVAHPRLASLYVVAALSWMAGRVDDSLVYVEAGMAMCTALRVYDFGAIRSALNDLTTGACDPFMKLAPVLTELDKPVPGVEVVQRGISVENIAVAVPLADQALLGRLTVAQSELEQNGTLQRIRRKWLGNPYADQRLAMH